MAHNTNLEWKIYVGENEVSVYIDDPSEGFWFSSITEAEQFRLTLANENVDPLTAFAFWK